MAKLMRVKDGMTLHWPEGMTPRDQRVRGSSGHVVDLEAPCEPKWCAGQEYKLEPAPEGATASEITCRTAQNQIEAAKRAAGKAPKVEVPQPSIGGAMPRVEMPRKVAAR